MQGIIASLNRYRCSKDINKYRNYLNVRLVPTPALQNRDFQRFKGPLYPGDLKEHRCGQASGYCGPFGFVAGTDVTFDIRHLFFGQKQLRGSMASDIEDLKWGLEQVRAGRIQPSLDHTLPLSQAGEAHRQIASNEITGNIVLLPWT